MPQGRRKVPFSAKQKKQQLQAKRDKKREPSAKSESKGHGDSDNDGEVVGSEGQQFRLTEKQSINEQPRLKSTAGSSSNYDPNRYRLQFHREPKEEIERRKRLASKEVQRASDETLEVDFEDVFVPGSELDMPKRPSWKYGMSKERIDAQENRYFTEYLNAVENKFASEELSFFELNLETWRQLWRVLEMSDIVFIVVDIRFPSLLMSPVLYDYVTRDLGKDIVVVLNKIDLAPPSLIVAWKHYFVEKFPLANVVCFTAFPGLHTSDKDSSKSVQKQGRLRLRMAAEGASKILEVCQRIVKDKVDLNKWKEKIREELEDITNDYDEPVDAPVTISKFDTHFEEYQRFRDGLLTIGFIGQPNVGKSSLLNALVGKKVVSVSKTPGHTKHFQTIFLTDNVRLCDCPGLVFPSKVPKSLQVLAGSYPIAHLQEPYSSVRFLAEHLDLPRLLNIRHPDDEGRGGVASSSIPWSPLDICEAWAEKRGFKTAKAARNDTYRAANHILRLALDGRICVYLRPKGYTKNKDKWESHSDVTDVCKIISRSREGEVEPEEEMVEVESTDDEEEEESSDDSDEREVVKGRLVASNKFALLDDD